MRFLVRHGILDACIVVPISNINLSLATPPFHFMHAQTSQQRVEPRLLDLFSDGCVALPDTAHPFPCPNGLLREPRSDHGLINLDLPAYEEVHVSQVRS